MVGSVARLGARLTRGALAVVITAVAVLCSVHAGQVRDRALAEAAQRAVLVAQTRLAPLLDEGDLSSPITGARYDQLASAVRRIADRAGIERLTIWSDIGRILFSMDQKLVGTRPTYIRDIVYGVANGTTQTEVETGALKTFTPLWRRPGGTVVVAELDQPFGPIAAASRAWQLAAGVGGLVSLVCWVLFAMSWRAGASGTAARSLAQVGSVRRSAPGPAMTGPMGYAPPSGASLRRSQPPGAPAPAHVQAGMREMEQARIEAEQRAKAAEDRLKRLQQQHKQAMERLQALEARLSVAAAAPKQSQEELRALRDQVRESAERLHTAERENQELRARLSRPHLPGVVGAGGGAR